jgi:predicted Zn-dependent protease with MMP-like domain
MAYHVGKTRFAELVDLALEDVPDAFRQYLDEVRLEIADRPTPEQGSSVGLRSNSLLLGLYQGRPRTARSVMDSAVFPDVIWIFQDSIERIVADEAALVEQVRKTVLHEIGHHFGLSEEDLVGLGYG